MMEPLDKAMARYPGYSWYKHTNSKFEKGIKRLENILGDLQTTVSHSLLFISSFRIAESSTT